MFNISAGYFSTTTLTVTKLSPLLLMSLFSVEQEQVGIDIVLTVIWPFVAFRIY